jgi:hypothetical protein
MTSPLRKRLSVDVWSIVVFNRQLVAAGGAFAPTHTRPQA